MGLVVQALRCPDEETRRGLLLQAAGTDSASLYKSDLLAELQVNLELSEIAARSARWLVVQANYDARELGVAMLRLCGSADDVERLTQIACSVDGPPLDAVRAMADLADHPVEAVWRIAKADEGMARGYAVDELAGLLSDQSEIRRWILIQGWQIRDSDHWVACAEAGGLAGALDGPMDDELLGGVFGLVANWTACVEPGQCLEDWPEAPQTLTRLLTVLESHRYVRTASDAATGLHQWCSEWLKAAAPPPGWSVDSLESIRDRCTPLMG